MADALNRATLSNVLNRIEKHELTLLGWGIVDGYLGEAELLELIENAEPDLDAGEVLDELVDLCLIDRFGLLEHNEFRYRSRMAETVRLSSGLRQWFHGKPWQDAKPLVSDFRFLSQPRLVPDRTEFDLELLMEFVEKRNGRPVPSDCKDVVEGFLAGRTVSAFQARSTARMLGEAGDGPKGTCIAAGTGAGKTLAFYLGVLGHLASTPSTGSSRLIALYPRIELLRDQVATLLASLKNLSHSTENALTVGVLYGEVPRDRQAAEHSKYQKWVKRNDGLECPIVGCLKETCHGKLIWLNKDGENQVLTCESCKAKVHSLIFTRKALSSQPPDVLVATTEMLNRSLSFGSPSLRLFIGKRGSRPEFLLLDEIHTYSGVHGAQIAHLIRRWKNQIWNKNVHIVGLSATLADPNGFFCDLTGLFPHQVEVVAPREEELRDAGRQYFLALRGDPASKTSLLATTIQASMLVRRMLDQNLGTPSEGTFGSRLFVFTDKLDLVNRLHEQLRDAEGWKADGVARKPQGSLALLRKLGEQDSQRDKAGQLWRFAETQLITLTRSAKVGLTSSQSSGVGDKDDIVVATASLEVGFDDPKVGAIIQHKAPRDAASFLQRRGRAGRDPSMRPWAVVVLSDYGRDRLAFQAYDTLADPVVPPINLPTKNRVILKMQATWMLLGLLSQGARGAHLNRLFEKGSSGGSFTKEERKAAKEYSVTASEFLTEQGIEKLKAKFKFGLGVEDEDVRSILWDYPRAVASSLLPTLIRYLDSVAVSGELPSGYRWRNPTRDFVPGTLFNDLQVPEVELELPFKDYSADTDTTIKTEPIGMALREYAPGKVSYRHAPKGKRERVWLAPPTEIGRPLRVEDFSTEYVELRRPPGDLDVRLVRLEKMILTKPDYRVEDSTSGKWLWETALVLDADPYPMHIPSTSGWLNYVVGLEVMTHEQQCPLIVWRYAREIELDAALTPDPSARVHQLSLRDESVGVGFMVEVDAIRFSVKLPTEEYLNDLTRETVTSLVSARFEYLMRTDEKLIKLISNVWLRKWIAEIAISVIAIEAVTAAESQPGETSVLDVYQSLSPEELSLLISDAAHDVFGALEYETESSLVSEIKQVLNDQEIQERVYELIEVLTETPTFKWLPWVQERYLTTLTAAMSEAIQALCPDVDADSLLPDITRAEGSDDVAEVWISENQPGGMGVVEAFVESYSKDPQTYWALVSKALAPGFNERVDKTLSSFLQVAGTEVFLPAMQRIRHAVNLEELSQAWGELKQLMFENGFDCDPTVITAMAARFLRQGSSGTLGEFTNELLLKWQGIEADLGFEIDVRAFAYLATKDPQIRLKLATEAGRTGDQTDWGIGQIVGLLWARGKAVRESSLQIYNPYVEMEPTERLLFEGVGPKKEDPVDASEESWRSQVDEKLSKTGSCGLKCEGKDRATELIKSLLVESTFSGVLELYPRIVGLNKSGNVIEFSIELREAHG
jgi:superfamily II DNA/RNA helicase